MGQHTLETGGVGVQAVIVIDGIGVVHVIHVVVYGIVPPQNRVTSNPVFESAGGRIADVGEHIVAGKANLNVLMDVLNLGI